MITISPRGIEPEENSGSADERALNTTGAISGGGK